jgi:hypothetical protein
VILKIVVRGFCQVAPVAASTYFVAHNQIGYAAACSFLISFIWWSNAGTSGKLAGMRWACAYASGAMLGTLFGMRLAEWLAR